MDSYNIMLSLFVGNQNTVQTILAATNVWTHFSPPSCCVTSLASVACSDISLANADDVFPLAIFSNNRPRETKINNIGGVSKNVFGTTLVYVAPMITTMTLIIIKYDCYTHNNVILQYSYDNYIDQSI